MPDAGNVKGVGYFAYTDAISYLGLHEMAQLLAEWGHPEGAGLLKEAESYRQGHRRRHRAAHRQVERSLVRSLGAARAEV